MRRILVAVIVMAGMLVPTLSEPASATPPAVLTCSGRGTIRHNSPYFPTLAPVTYTAYAPSKTDNPTQTQPCTGDLAATTGNLAKVTFALKGTASCADLTGATGTPMSGILRLTYANINPATGLRYFTKASVRLQPEPSPTAIDLPEAVHVTGQITKGIGAGATLSTDMLMQPIPTMDFDQSGTVDIPTETSGPTMDSYLTWMTPAGNGPCPQSLCAFGVCETPTMRWDTDGPGLLTLHGDTNAQLHSAFQIIYQPRPMPGADPPVMDCDASGKIVFTQPSPPTLKAHNVAVTKPTPPPMTCGGTASATTGNIRTVSFNLAGDGLATCGDATSTPLHGTLTLTYTNINPATGKRYYSRADVTNSPQPCPYDPGACEQPQPFLPGEVACLTGIVNTGIGAPGDISIQVLVHPIPTQDWDHNGTIDIPTAQTPTMDSYLQFVDDQTNVGPIPHPMIWSTAGNGYGTLLGDPTAVLDNGIVISPMPQPGS